MMRRGKSFVIGTLLLACILFQPAVCAEGSGGKTGPAELPAEETGVLPYWEADSPAMASIIGFVEAVTDETSPEYVVPEERIALFDSDGTLIGERYPTYSDQCMLIQRLLHDEDGKGSPEDIAFAKDLEAAIKNHEPLPDSPKSTAQMAAESFAGFTPEEYRAYVREFLKQPVEGFEGMTYGDRYFLPMVSLVEYLAEHDFRVYICSGTERLFLREMVEETLGRWIPPYCVIGSTFSLTATGQGDTAPRSYTYAPDDQVLLEGNMIFKNLKMNKVVSIVNEIGVAPLLVFGNSSGDFAMGQYALQNGGRAYMLLCDDTERDYGDPQEAAAFAEKCAGLGFETVSMRDEFGTIYKEGIEKTKPYTLDRVVVLSRHNIRSPLSGGGSLLDDITPHTWFEWTSNPSELSLRGAMLETMMGQYFRLWFEKEGLFPENYRPEEGAVRFYANARQRTLATARYFSAGLLPVAEISIESHVPYDTTDPVFTPALNFMTEDYAADVEAQVAGMGGTAGMQGIQAELKDAISLLMDVTDMEESESYQAGVYGDLLSGETTLILEAGNEPGMKGPIKTATSVADALTLQYYEEPDAVKAAFGHDLTEEDWQKIHSIVDTYSEMLFTTPLVCVNVAHPLLQEIRSELTAGERKFSFLCGHDCNIASVLAAMGVEDYLLPGAIEQHTPIGAKLVFERWTDADGAAYYKVSLVYQSTDQMRNITPLSLENPPMKYALYFPETGENADGMIPEEELLAILDRAISEYDELQTQYEAEADPAA